MVNAGTGANTGRSAYDSGFAAVTDATHSLTGTPAVIFLYTSADYPIDEVLRGAVAAAPGVPIVGNTSFTGVVTPAGFAGGAPGFTGALAAGGEELAVAVAGAPIGDDARATGRAVATRAQADLAGREPDWFYMTANPGQEEDFLKGVEDVIGRVPFFGGSAADNTISGDWQLYANSETFGSGVAIALISSTRPIANVFTGAYRETADVGIISGVDGARRLTSIDGQPALARYASWRGLDTADLQGGALLAATVTSPLGVKDPLGDLTLIRHPMAGNPDGSMDVGNNLATGTAVIRMESTVDELIASAPATLETLKKRLGAEPAFYHLVHCGGRRAGIADRIEELAEALVSATEGVPFITEFTFGEYGFEDNGSNSCGGLMLSFTAFAK